MHIIRVNKDYRQVPKHDLEVTLDDLRDELQKLAKKGISTTNVCEARLLLSETISGIKETLVDMGLYREYEDPTGSKHLGYTESTETVA